MIDWIRDAECSFARTLAVLLLPLLWRRKACRQDEGRDNDWEDEEEGGEERAGAAAG